MQRFQSITNWAAAFTQLGHIFCCGLPALFSVLSLLSGLGIMMTIPKGLETIHHTMHDYEMPLIMTAGIITVLGWVLHLISIKLDCRTTGCAHGPCGSKKNRSSKVLIFSTILFAINLVILFTVHGAD